MTGRAPERTNHLTEKERHAPSCGQSVKKDFIAIEKGTEQFKTMAQNKRFDRVDTPDESGTCKLTLIDGTEMDCLVAAREETGDWMVLTLEGEIKQFSHLLVKRGDTR